MLDWFSALPMMMQVFWGCAIVGSAIFVVQVVLMLIGIDSDVADMDFDTGDTLDLGGGEGISDWLFAECAGCVGEIFGEKGL